jgi:hypothetical protein
MNARSPSTSRGTRSAGAVRITSRSNVTNSPDARATIIIGTGKGPLLVRLTIADSPRARSTRTNPPPLVSKFSLDGALRWGTDIDGGFGLDLGYAVAVDAEDRIIAGGTMMAEPMTLDPWLAVFSP